MGAQATWISGGRLHLHHGPIDMIVGAEGPGVQAGFARAIRRFDTLLEDLAAELPRLRSAEGPLPVGDVAQDMVRTIERFPEFSTPMAAVAGAGADAILAALTDGPGVCKAYVNNGGDIAFHLGESAVFRVAMAGTGGQIEVSSLCSARGIATSGRHGRSLSFGIADSVTVLAENAALADVAATLIANAVDLPTAPEISRAPACEQHPDSDLGTRLVTTHVAPLTDAQISNALTAGMIRAESFRAADLIHSAALTLGSQTRIAGLLPLTHLEAIDA
ncbi:MAG: UPF0280 family protein [Roseovarius sp.]